MSLTSKEIEKYLTSLDGRGSDEEFSAVDALSALGSSFPELLLQRYRQSRKWGERASCVYHATKYAESSKQALQLGIEALADRSFKVRYRACMLLAVAQSEKALRPLEELRHDPKSEGDALAAIDAITNRNVHFFVDREHTGKVTLCVSSSHS